MKNINIFCLLVSILCSQLWARDRPDDLKEAFEPYGKQSISIVNHSREPVGFCIISQLMCELAPNAKQRVTASSGFSFALKRGEQEFLLQSFELENPKAETRTAKFLQRSPKMRLNPGEQKIVSVALPSYIQGLLASDESDLPELGWACLGDQIVVEFGADRQKYLDWRGIGGVLQKVWTPAWSRNLFGMQDSDIETQCRRLMRVSEETYFQDPPVLVHSIPHAHHRFWITDDHEAPQDRLDFFIETCRTLNQRHGDWSHFLWCVDPLKISNTVSYLMAANVGIQIRTIREIQSTSANHLIDAFLGARLFVFANDILRIKVAHEFGGLCCDIGVSLKPNMVPLIDRYDYIWWLWRNTFDFCVMGTRSGDPVLAKYLSIVDRLYEMPSSSRSVSCWIAPPLLGSVLLSVLASLEKDLKMLFLSNGSFASNCNLGSWSMNSDARVPKFGNSSARDSGLDPYSIRPKK